MSFNVTPKSLRRTFIALTAIWLLGWSATDGRAAAPETSSLKYWWYPGNEKPQDFSPENWYGRSPSLLTVTNTRNYFAAGPIYSTGISDENILNPLLCIGCTIQNPGYSHDGDPNTASHISIVAGVGGRIGQRIIFPGTYQGGDSIVLDFEVPTAVLNASVLSNIRVEAFNGTSSVTVTDLNSLTNIQVLGTGIGTSGKQRAIIPVSGTFDRVEVTINSALSALGGLYIYEVTAVVPVTVSPAGNPVVSPAGSAATLNASSRLGAATFRWYDAPTGGNLLATGSTFTTPVLFRGIKHYYVEATTTADNKTSFIRTAVNVIVGGGPGPLWTYGDRQESPFITGVCIGCDVTNANNAADGDPTTASSIIMPVGALGSVSQLIHFPGIYQAGDSIALDVEIPDQILNTQLLGGISFQTYNGNTPNADAITLDNPLARLRALGAGFGSTGKFRITVPVSNTFDGVKIGTSAILAGLSGLRLYEAVAFMPVTVTPPAPVIPSGGTATMAASVRAPGATYNWYDVPTGGTPLATTASFTTPPLTRSRKYYVEAATPDGKTSFVRTAAPVTVSGGPGPLWVYADQQQSPIISGVCVGCVVQSPDKAVDGDTTTASQAIITVGALGSVGQLLKFPGTYQAGDSIAFTLGVPSQLINAQLLSGIRVQTFNGATPNNDAVMLNSNLTNLQLLGLDPTGSVGKFRVTIPVNNTFDGAQVDLTGLVSGLSSLNIYEAAAFIPVSVVPPKPSVAFGNSAKLNASIRLPNATFNWYDVPTGGTPLATGATFNTPVMMANKTYYVEAATPDGLKSYVRTAVPINVTVGPASPDLSCGRATSETHAVTGVLCLLCSVDSAALAVDDNPQTASRLHVPVGLLGGVYQRLKFDQKSKVGDSLRIVVGATTGLLDLSLLDNVTLRPRNSGTENTADVRPLNSSLLSLQLLNGGTQTVITFAPSQVFDEVEVNVTGVLKALTEINVYYAQQITPRATVAADTVNVCSGQTATLNATGPAGATFKWYDAPSGGNLVLTGASYTTPPVTANAVYYVSAISGGSGCASEVRKPVFVIVGLPNVSVTASSITIPQGGTATFNVNTPDPTFTYKWYSTPTGGTALATGTSFTTPPLNATTTYYVEASNASGCVSAQRIPVVANVQITNPDAPCDIATAQISNVNGLCVGCYVDNQGSAVDGSTQTYSTIHVVLGLLGGYAQQTLIFPNPSDAGDSVRLVLSFPSSLADVNVLGGVEIATYNGTTYNNDRAALTSGLLNLKLLSGNQQAQVTFAPAAVFDRVEVRMNAGIATAISALNIHYAQRFVPVPVVQSGTVNTCAGGTATLNVTPRANTLFRWYTTPTGGTPIFTGPAFVSGPVTTDTAFYVEAVKTSINCANPVRTKATVKLTGAPAAPTLDNTSVTTCSGSTAVIKATAPAGATFKWYAQQTGGTALFTGDTFTTPVLDSSVIYYAEAVSSGGCASVARTAVQVNVTARPATPDVTPASAVVCAGSTTTLTATSTTPGATFNWYSDAALTNKVFTGASFTTPALTTTTTYYVTAANGQCTSAAAKAVTIQVNDVPATPTVTISPASGTVNYGQTATLTASSVTPGATYRWYLDAVGGTPLSTNAVYTTNPLANTTTYYVEAVSASGCASGRTSVTVNVNRNFNPGCDFANSQTNSVNGVCLLCSVNNPDNAVDNDTTNFANLQVGVGAVGGNVTQVLNFGSLAAAGDTVKLRFAFPTGLADVSVLSAIKITSYNGATSNNDTKTLDPSGIRVILLGGTNDRIALFAPGGAYDRIEIRLESGIATALVNMNIYYANRVLSSPTVTADNTMICAGSKATLTATASDSATIRWYTVPVGGTPVFTGKVFTTPALTAITTYYAESYRASTNCANPVRTSVTIQVLPVPATPAIVKGDTAVCPGNTAVLIAQPQDAGTTIRWFASAAGGTPLSTGNSYSTGALTTTTVFYAEAYNGTCGSATRVPVTVTVGSAPPDPVLESNNLAICAGSTATLRVTSNTAGVAINWYTVQSGGSPAGNGPTFTTPALSSTAIYYVQASNPIGGCPSASGRIQATVNVNAVPAVPVLTDNVKTTCRNQSATLSVKDPVPGITYNWYDAPAGGTLRGTGATFTTPALTDTATYFVEAVAAGNCTSAGRAVAAVSVIAKLDPPAVESANVTVCRGTQATLKVMNPLAGVTYNWYDAPGGNKLFTGATFTTGAMVSAATYYVEAVGNGGCTSTGMTAVNIQVTDAPAPPVVTGNTVTCANEPTTLSIQNPLAGFTYTWYDSPDALKQVAQGTTFSPTGIATTTTFYVMASSGTCSSPLTSVTVTVNPAPAPVIVDATSKTICTGNTASFHVVNPQTGISYRWYDAAIGGNIVASTPDFTTPALATNKDYYVTAINGSNCMNPVRTKVSVIITSGPAVPVTDASTVTVCRGNRATSKVTNVQAGLQYRWYNAPIGGTLLFVGDTYTTADPLTMKDTVYVEATTPGGTCTSGGRAQVILIPADAPATPVLVNGGAVQVCSGGTATFTVQNPPPNVVYNWYDAATGGNLLQGNGGASFTTNALTTNFNVYVEAVIGGGCSSPGRAQGTATVSPVPQPPAVTADANIVCPDSSATLRASSAQAGAIFSWYTSATGGTAVFTGPVFKTPGIRAVTTYYVAAGFSGGCVSATRTPITINVHVPLAAPTVTVVNKTATSITFQWNAIAGALGYRVSTDGGRTFTQPSSGLTGTTHTVNNLQPNQIVTLQVMTIGASECANSAWFQGNGGTDNPAGNTIFVPNAFTPNNDGLNDVLYVYGTTIANMQLRIYNQWGQLVFESRDKGQGWDGKMGGRIQPVGVYTYVLKATLQDGTSVQKRGTITIIR